MRRKPSNNSRLPDELFAQLNENTVVLGPAIGGDCVVAATDANWLGVAGSTDEVDPKSSVIMRAVRAEQVSNRPVEQNWSAIVCNLELANLIARTADEFTELAIVNHLKDASR